ncbi:O-antigen ligase family protein [Sphingomonas cavernae]|uniref:O-antigen ligase-related domain-containing protein n=1 Tax=Sphingomonas cavernae TaxID=2320861 RepID=A0A418W6Y4_9SPHN|nr:O-antigen ligase family protein [Sphingomonas cavernae]RJF85769.1 hypothetical protein D3876_17975 [Sphingomonas cavernae]
MGGAPSFPIPILFVVTALLAATLLAALRRVEGRAARFVIAAVWARYILSVFHTVTYDQAFAGFSWNAIGSIAITAAGFLVIQPRHLMLKALFPVYAIILLVLTSAALNEGIVTALDSVVKYGYFIVVMVAAYEALRQNGPERFFGPLLWAFAPLLVFQLLSIATGTVKASELDGSVSYIGGYNHEAAFSVALATFFVVACFTETLRKPLKAALLLILIIGIALANYRTTIIALLPLAALQTVSGTVLSFRRDQRVILFLVMAVVAFAAIAILALQASDRFADLALFLGDPGQFIKPQHEFSIEERRLLSGRAYIWSGYIFTWLDASTLRHLFGFGPDSWENWFKVYPHNTLVAFLFELGVAGLAALLLFWAAMLGQALRARGAVRYDLVFAHLSFILMNLATMALWQVEGIILYAIVCGYSLFSAVEAGAPRYQVGSRRARA